MLFVCNVFSISCLETHAAIDKTTKTFMAIDWFKPHLREVYLMWSAVLDHQMKMNLAVNHALQGVEWSNMDPIYPIYWAT